MRSLKQRAPDGCDAQRSRAWDGRHLHRTAFPGTARQGRCGAVQVCSPEAHSPNLSPFSTIVLASSFFCSRTLSTSAPPPVTPTVRRLSIVGENSDEL